MNCTFPDAQRLRTLFLFDDNKNSYSYLLVGEEGLPAGNNIWISCEPRQSEENENQ